MMTMSAVDFLAEYFECEHLIAPMAVSGIIGTFLGVRSPGTAYVLLHHYMGEIDGSYRAWGLPKGGTGAIADAIAASARDLCVEIRVEAPVAHLLLERGVARGVVLDNGDEIRARAVVSGLDPHRTFLKLVGEESLPPELLVSAAELESLIETAHLLRSPKNAERLLAALARAQRNELKPSTVAELRKQLGLDREAR